VTQQLRPVLPTSLDESLTRLRSCLSPYTGIAREATEILHAPDEGRMVTMICTLATAEELLGAAPPAHSSGWHSRRDVALAAAVGEALERYSAVYVPTEELVVGTADELGAPAVRPERFALFHERQYEHRAFRFKPFRGDTRVSWIRGFGLPDGDTALLPAQCVFISSFPAGEPCLAVPTSNGLACGATLEEAVLAGLLELVERDAVMLAWYNRLSLPLLDWSRDDAMCAVDEWLFRPVGLRYSAVDLSCFFGLPCVLGVVHGAPGQLGALGVGAACAITVQEAWRKALSEAFAVRRWARESASDADAQIPDDPFDICGFDDHILFYAEHERAARAAFLDASVERRHVADITPVAGDDVASRVRSVTSRLASSDVGAYAVDITSPDVADAGLVVARVVAPELCGLDVAGAAPQLGGRRMAHAAFEAGLVSRPLDMGDFNRDPHPFP
jgi:ribosomal protein S12 methylthiotransferase accessory factor